MEETKTIVAHLPLGAIVESPLNPRKTFDETKLEAFAQELKAHGVLSPILVRPVYREGAAEVDPALTRYEIVFGARRYRASVLAKLITIPATIRELNDRDALELMVVENLNREDVPPLEEADGYFVLVEDHGIEIAEIAAKVGKSEAYIYGRLKLCGLLDGGRKALLDGKISTSVAIKLARIADPGAQKEATKEIAGGDYAGAPFTSRRASDLIRNHYTATLRGAPFKAADAELVPSAGACVDCPKYTANTPELFEDGGKTHSCTDLGCYRSKCDAAFALRAEHYRSTGGRVLTGSEAHAVFKGGTSAIYSSGYKALSETNHQDPKQRTYKALIGKQAPVVLAQNGAGAIVELVEVKLIPGLLKAAGHRSESQAAPGRPGMSSSEKSRRELGAAKRAAVIEGMIDAAELAPSARYMEALVLAVIGQVWSDTAKGACLRRSIEHGKRADWTELLAAEADGKSPRWAKGLVMELLMRQLVSGADSGGIEKKVLKLLGVNVKALRAKATTAVMAQRKTAAGAKKAKAESKKKTKVGGS